MQTFRQKLKAARKKARLPQPAAAAAVSPFLSVRTLQWWENSNGGEPLPWVQELILEKLKKIRSST